MPATPLRIALIGAGRLGAIHAKLLREISSERDDVIFAGIYDADPARAAAVAKDCGVAALASLGTAAMRCDAAIVATTTSTHFTIAAFLLEQKKHLFIEKPITATITEADALIKLEQANGVKIQVGHIERFNPALVAIEAYIHRPRFITAERLAGFQLRATDVSVVHDLMIHDIDLILSLVNSEVVHVSASGMKVFSDEIDIANARLEFANGAVANVTASRLSRTKARKMRFFSTDPNTYASLDFSTGKSEVFRLLSEPSGRKTKLKEAAAAKILSLFGDIAGQLNGRTIDYISPDAPKVNAMKMEQTSFIDAVRGDTPVKVSSSDGRQALSVAMQIVERIAEAEAKMNGK
ncbi:MAG: Gfo/Idh/MocA family oxidoreductase [Rhizobacter sp.]|nr:Gfo/Idh/MocA family oxidoreductase [Chlorobiales bacterium]